MSDLINSPDHYVKGNFECIDVIECITSEMVGTEAICTGNIVKYVWRWQQKGGVESLKKARWYLDRLINKLESST